MDEKNWVANLALKAIRICRLNKQAVGNHRQDLTMPVLERLQNEGYSQVMWNSGHSTHSECRDLNRQRWDLEDFLRTTEYDAPLFSRSHPGDENCTLIVSGEGVPDIELDSYGDTDEAIGVGRPVKVPPAPKVKTKVLAPTPEPKVVEKPVEPETKIKYVSPEVHKQIKDPFEHEKFTPEQYEDWLKDLEKENVIEEEKSAQPTEQEIEDWQKDVERETSLKIPHWVRGIFER
jgi:hypothetical protein